MNSWDKYFMDMAVFVASKSKDRSIQVGCVITGANNNVLTTGYNGFPRGCYDEAKDVVNSFGKFSCIADMNSYANKVEARHERPAKYKWTEHAERNAIYNAARHGVKLDGSRIYLPWYPCMDCARAIVQAGITEVVCVQPDFEDTRWGADFKMVAELFQEVGMSVRYVDFKLPQLEARNAAQKAQV